MPEQINHTDSNSSPVSKLDSYLRIEDAARRLSISKSWLYQNREKLPFMVRLPGGPLRVSVARLRKWLRSAK